MANFNKVYLIEQYQSGKSIPDIASALGASQSGVRYQLIKAGVALRPRGDGVRLASCKISATLRGRSRGPRSEETKRKLSVSRMGTGCGFSVKKGGYVELTTGPHKGRGQHVVIMGKIIGRRLSRNEVVHHIDGDTQNNSPKNLQLMTRSAHTSLHRRESIKAA